MLVTIETFDPVRSTGATRIEIEIHFVTRLSELFKFTTTRTVRSFLSHTIVALSPTQTGGWPTRVGQLVRNVPETPCRSMQHVPRHLTETNATTSRDLHLGSAGQELPHNALIVHVGDEVGSERYLRDCRRSAHIVRTLVQTRTDAYRGFELEDSHAENTLER